MGVKACAWLLLICWATAGSAQRQSWQIGGAGLAWSEGDSLVVLVDFDSVPGAIQPVYIEPDKSLLSLFTGWEPLKEPRELTYVEGETPRAWKGSQGNETTAHNGTYMVDGDSMTFNPPVSSNPESVWYTIDLAVPVPAHRFGFFTPPRGFRADGIPFAQDAVPAYEVSIAAEGDPSWLVGNQPYRRIGPLIAAVAENFAARVQIEFPRQYVRFVRYKRKTSLLDSAEGQTYSTGSGAAFKGSIGDFELFGAGVPRRVVYRSRIFDLGAPRNFGRLFWAATPLRVVDGALVEASDAEVGVEVEVRTGRDGDPNIYQEYTDRGGEEVVTRERYDLVLQPRWRAGRLRDPRPGMRASIQYDSDNWSFWAMPFAESGQAIDLKGGTHFQLRITLKSEDFAAFVRLDSLWIETAPLLARRVLGEVALLGDAQPAGGLTQVPLGAAEFAYDIRGEFTGEGAGFDALRIRTGTRAAFTRLEMGEPPRVVEPVAVTEGDEELAVVLPERIGPGYAAGVRVVFVADVFSLAWTFSGEVYNDGVDALPQPIEPGDASAELGTNSLRVLGMAGQGDGPVVGLDFSTRVLTPNGDGVHDEVEIGYALVGLPEDVPVVFKVYSLDGRRVAKRSLGAQRSGAQRVRWDGRDEDGAEDLHVAPSVDALAIEFVDALVQEARGRIWPREARLNEDTRFTYKLWTDADEQDSGFDLLRFHMPGATTGNVVLRIGGEEVAPAAVRLHGDSLWVSLPRTVVADSVEVDFTARLWDNAALFALDLGMRERLGIWQSVMPSERRANLRSSVGWWRSPLEARGLDAGTFAGRGRLPMARWRCRGFTSAGLTRGRAVARRFCGLSPWPISSSTRKSKGR